MALASRILQVNLTPPVQGGGAGPSQTITFDQGLDIRVRARKAALQLQNTATVEIYGMSTAMRSQLLSQITAYLQAAVNKGEPVGPSTGQTPYWSCHIFAGYSVISGLATASQSASQSPSLIFVGDVVEAKPISSPPNIGVQLTIRTVQTFKLNVPVVAPTNTTVKGLVQWAAQQMGFPYSCNTSYDNVQITNPARSVKTVAAILPWIQDYRRPDIAAFVDNNFLYVKDRNKIVATAQSPVIDEFIGMPFWDEYGVQFQTLFTPTLVLASGVFLSSEMNPSLNNTSNQNSGSNVATQDVTSGSNSSDSSNNGYVIYEIEYNLCSRETPFYSKCYAAPSG